MSQPTPARRLALRILGQVQRGGETLGERLAAPDASRLDPRERAFLHELLFGTLRQRGALDHALGPLLDRPVSHVDPVSMDILRLGAHQLLNLRVPDRAAVSESVELAKAETPRAAGFVNAVLRKLARTGPPAAPDPVKDPKRWLTTVGSIPDWLAERWLSRLGPVVAVARARALLLPSPVAFRLNPRVADARKRCEDAGLQLVPLQVPGAFVAEGGRLTELASDGVLYIQDQGSQLVAHLAAGRGLTLDACAAPGGKATLIADLAGEEGRVVAAEASKHRLRAMAGLCRNWGSAHLDLVLADGVRPPFARCFDTVLVDAPCSGLGTLARHPDIRWRAKAVEVPRHALRQQALLGALALLVRPGGRLVYATCSLEDEETTGVVQHFLRQTPSFRVGAVPEWARAYAGPDGFVRTLPERDPGDGFFAALLAERPGRNVIGSPRMAGALGSIAPLTKKPFRRSLLQSALLGLALLATAATSAVLTMRSVLTAQDVVVPSLVGRALSEAFALAAQQSLSVKVEGKRHDPQVPADRVAAAGAPRAIVPEVAPIGAGLDEPWSSPDHRTRGRGHEPALRAARPRAGPGPDRAGGRGRGSRRGRNDPRPASAGGRGRLGPRGGLSPGESRAEDGRLPDARPHRPSSRPRTRPLARGRPQGRRGSLSHLPRGGPGIVLRQIPPAGHRVSTKGAVSLDISKAES